MPGRLLNANAAEMVPPGYTMRKKASMRPCLFHVPTGEVVKSYAQLSRIFKSARWNIFVEVSLNVWAAWRLDETGKFHSIRLPHGAIAAVTEPLLRDVVKAIGDSVLCIAHLSEKGFVNTVHQKELEQLLPKLSLNVPGYPIISDLPSLYAVLVKNGWVSVCQFYYKESRSEGHPASMVNLPRVPFYQLTADDLEYLTIATGDLFKVRYVSTSHAKFSKANNDPTHRKAGKVLESLS